MLGEKRLIMQNKIPLQNGHKHSLPVTVVGRLNLSANALHSRLSSRRFLSLAFQLGGLCEKFVSGFLLALPTTREVGGGLVFGGSQYVVGYFFRLLGWFVCSTFVLVIVAVVYDVVEDVIDQCGKFFDIDLVFPSAFEMKSGLQQIER